MPCISPRACLSPTCTILASCTASMAHSVERWVRPACLLGPLIASQFPVKGTGTVAFANGRPIDADASDVYCVFAADLDGDGDQDILASSFDDNWLKWYENEDGNGTFSETAHVVNTSSYEGAM